MVGLDRCPGIHVDLVADRQGGAGANFNSHRHQPFYHKLISDMSSTAKLKMRLADKKWRLADLVGARYSQMDIAPAHSHERNCPRVSLPEPRITCSNASHI